LKNIYFPIKIVLVLLKIRLQP